jgi:hypothetical protein
VWSVVLALARLKGEVYWAEVDGEVKKNEAAKDQD